MISRWSSVCPSVCSSVRLSYVRLSVFLFPDDNLSKNQWIFANLGMCIDIVEIWFGIANGQISSIFDGVRRYLPVTCPFFLGFFLFCFFFFFFFLFFFFFVSGR